MRPRSSLSRSTSVQRTAIGRAGYLAHRIGVALRDARLARGLTQRDAAARAGIAQPHWSRLERGLQPRASLTTLAACAAAVDAQLAAFVEALPGADLPRDMEHLRRQALLVELSRAGRWTATPEAPLTGDPPRPRSIDVLLEREPQREAAVVEIWDLILDVGAAMRGLEAKVAATRARLGPQWRVEGLLIVRRTHRNRGLVRDLAGLFAARYPSSSRAWLGALTSPNRPMPHAAGFAWTDVRGTRLLPARLR